MQARYIKGLGTWSLASVGTLLSALLICTILIPTTTHAIAIECQGPALDDAELTFDAEDDYRLTAEEASAAGLALSQEQIADGSSPPPLHVTIVRTCCTGSCTFGELSIDGDSLCKTLELPDRGNQQSISCIPPGEYSCERVYSPRFEKYLYEIKNVNGRTKILIHSGNSPSDTEGCVLVGMAIDVDKNRISRSREALDKLLKRLNGARKIKITIKDKTVEPTPTPVPPTPVPTATAKPADTKKPKRRSTAAVEGAW